jgi:Lipocalin-like domain
MIPSRMTAALALCFGFAVPAIAQGLQQKLVGAWTLESGIEKYQDGKQLEQWTTGNLILDPTGHMSLFLVGREQPTTTSPSVRTPVGPFVGYYGTYTVNEAEMVVTWKIDKASSPLFNGAVRTQKISFNGDSMTLVGSDVKTPEGTMNPINKWKPVK